MKKTLGVNANWKEMMFDVCAMLRGKPSETQLAYNFVYAMTNGDMSYSSDRDITIADNQLRMSDTVLKHITDSELLQLQAICKAIRERAEGEVDE